MSDLCDSGVTPLAIGAVACPTLIPGVVHVVCPRPRLVEIRLKKRNESQISHSIVHALSARGRLHWFSFLPAVCLHLGLYVRCGAVLDRCGPMWSHFSPVGSDVVISRTGGGNRVKCGDAASAGC